MSDGDDRLSDLRDFIAAADRLGELRVARGADPELEIGAVTDLAQHRRDGPAVLFDDIVGYPRGQRVFVNAMGSQRRSAMVLGLPTELEYCDLVPLWRERLHDCDVVINPVVVDGQVRGGVAQGLGRALYEEIACDQAGQPLTTTYLDYLLPTAMEVPPVEVGHLETPSPPSPTPSTTRWPRWAWSSRGSRLARPGCAS